MVILEDVQAQEVPWQLTSVQGPGSEKVLSAVLHLPSSDAGVVRVNGENGYCLRSDRTGSAGWDLWSPTTIEVAPSISSAVQEIARIEAGVPKQGVDFGPKTLPPELGTAFEGRHVSYTKGCYVGQEVLMRLHSRGHTNKTWMGLVADAQLEPGARVSHASREDAGQVTSAALSPTYGPIGAAMLRNESAKAGEQVTVHTSAGEVKARVVEMPILKS
jgi:folate-binding protein YgfZ